MTSQPRILLYRGLAAIRWFTRSDYGHVAIEIGGIVYEAQVKAGVVARRHDPDDGCTICDLPEMDREAIARMEEFLTQQVGKPYDKLGILRFISRTPESLLRWQDNWFCSELTFAGCIAGGIHLLG